MTDLDRLAAPRERENNPRPQARPDPEPGDAMGWLNEAILRHQEGRPTGVSHALFEARDALFDSNRPDGLGAAWAEAEAALPEKHAGITLRTDGDWGRIDGYQAWTYAAGEPTISVSGPTPAAALRALAARLKGDSDGG